MSAQLSPVDTKIAELASTFEAEFKNHLREKMMEVMRAEVDKAIDSAFAAMQKKISGNYSFSDDGYNIHLMVDGVKKIAEAKNVT